MDTHGHGHADGRVGVWTWMRCVWMWMSRKEKRKKKKEKRKKKKKKITYFVNADGGHVGLWKCCVWTCWRVDVDVLRADVDE